MTDIEKKSTGFTRLSLAQLEAEANSAKSRDKGRESVNIEPGFYSVNEETRRFATNQNKSIQSVRYSIQDGGDAIAALSSRKFGLIGIEGPQSEEHLIGAADGTVLLISKENGQSITLNITEAAARAGITAAGIRRTQQDIAADGEVDRVEQQTIINTITKAKGIAPTP